MKIKNIVWLCASVVLAVQAADAAGQNNFNVRAFGAVGNGTNLDSPAINKTIEACAQAGGGTVLIPAGTYLSGSIRLKSNIHLLIDAGAVILAILAFGVLGVIGTDPKRRRRSWRSASEGSQSDSATLLPSTTSASRSLPVP